MSSGTYTRYNSIAENLRVKIENLLFNVGILCRVFGRGKSDISIRKKMEGNPGKYRVGGKLIQDAVGLRIAVYFPEDIEVVRQLLCEQFVYDKESSTIDLPSDSTFSVVRYNLIFRVGEDDVHPYRRLSNGQPIDTTFEVQIRTMLSEGWHEVEHDLRYKCKDHWEQQQDLSRTLNGLIATLETAEWSMTRVFDELAYRHYKNGAWAAMLHTKLRMRLPPTLSEPLLQVLDLTPDLGKRLLRIDRTRVMQSLFALETKIPVTIDNVVFLWNYIVIKNDEISAMTERFLCEQFERAFHQPSFDTESEIELRQA
jgi:ppGpp synthetase/RelA/SpoT-type nucleotidyltranferase